MTIDDVSEKTGVARKTVENWIKYGLSVGYRVPGKKLNRIKLKAEKANNRVFIKELDFNEFMETRKVLVG